jgi:hypothetical protein
MPERDIETFIRSNPGLTATQIAVGLFGVRGYRQLVATTLRVLCAAERVERRGHGGPGEPFRYYPADKGASSKP